MSSSRSACRIRVTASETYKAVCNEACWTDRKREKFYNPQPKSDSLKGAIALAQVGRMSQGPVLEAYGIFSENSSLIIPQRGSLKYLPYYEAPYYRQ